MRLYIAGVNHFDPLCRDNLIKWMKEIKELERNLPRFIAPEWKYENFIMLKTQRTKLDKEVRAEEWSLNESQIEKIVLSLGYEGDAHEEVFGDIRLVWLDDKRDDLAVVADDYYKDRFNLLKSCSRFKKADEELLSAISTELKRRHAPSADRVRDNIFYDAIRTEANPEDNGYGVIVVGKNHAASEPETMRYLLEFAGYDCIVKDVTVSN